MYARVCQRSLRKRTVVKWDDEWVNARDEYGPPFAPEFSKLTACLTEDVKPPRPFQLEYSVSVCTSNFWSFGSPFPLYLPPFLPCLRRRATVEREAFFFADFVHFRNKPTIIRTNRDTRNNTHTQPHHETAYGTKLRCSVYRSSSHTFGRRRRKEWLCILTSLLIRARDRSNGSGNFARFHRPLWNTNRCFCFSFRIVTDSCGVRQTLVSSLPLTPFLTCVYVCVCV